MNDKRQKNQLVLAFREESRSEAPTASAEGTESLMAKCRAESPAIGEQWMEGVCERENCKQALARVKANKGSPGVDGMYGCFNSISPEYDCKPRTSFGPFVSMMNLSDAKVEAAFGSTS